ncbi:hypothetical protein V8D89_002918 [Ganoderma adspersum]
MHRYVLTAWDAPQHTLISTLRPLHKLTHLRIVISASIYITEDTSWPFPPWEEYAHSFHPSRFDFPGTAGAFACELPSLHHVFITTGGHFVNWVEHSLGSANGFSPIIELLFKLLGTSGHLWQRQALQSLSIHHLLSILFESSRMEASQLNIDVLTIVCEFLADVSDLLSVSLTCSSVHVVAVRWLLLTRPVWLKSGSSIHRFHSFLFADAPVRAPYVRIVHIDLTWPQPQADDGTLLLSILTSCKGLQHLTIAFRYEAFSIVVNPHFLQTIAAIPSLRSFTVRSQSIDALAVLPQFHAPVRMLGIHSSNIPAAARYPAFLEQCIPRAVVQTLEELQLDQFTIELDDNVQALANVILPSVLDVAPYPAVRSLSVGSLDGRPLLELLQHLFPALDATLRLSGLHIRRDEAVYASIRTANQHSQQRAADGSSRAWKRLDCIVCNAPMLYVLGLRCPIRLAMIEFGLLREHGRYVADALRENPVPRLKLSTSHHLGSAFGELFSSELSETLTHLTLCLLYSNDYGFDPPENGLTWPHVLDSIVSGLQPLHKLTHLRVVIGASVYVHKIAPSQFAPAEEYAHSFRGGTFNWEGTAATLSGARPSLQNIFLTTGGFLANWEEPAMEDADEGGGRWKPYERWYITHGWRVANSGSGTGRVPEAGLVELHEDVVETIIRNEELVLSEFDEVSFPTVANLRFLGAITAIPNLRSFTVRGESIDALVVLPRFRVPLRMLGIHSSNIPGAARYPAFLQQFFPRAIVPTLEVLELDRFTVGLHGGVQAPANVFNLPSVLDMMPYPAVRSLFVGYFEGKPLLNLLHHLFPALDDTLCLGSLNMRDEETYSNIRAANHRSQERDVDGVSHAWKKLDRVICDAPMLYVLGLRCPIRLVMIEFGLFDQHSRYAAHALRENPVPRLKISVNHDLGTTFGELFSPELGKTLTHLTLCLFYSNDHESTPSQEGDELMWDKVLVSTISMHATTHAH